MSKLMLVSHFAVLRGTLLARRWMFFWCESATVGVLHVDLKCAATFSVRALQTPLFSTSSQPTTDAVVGAAVPPTQSRLLLGGPSWRRSIPFHAKHSHGNGIPSAPAHNARTTHSLSPPLLLQPRCANSAPAANEPPRKFQRASCAGGRNQVQPWRGSRTAPCCTTRCT